MGRKRLTAVAAVSAAAAGLATWAGASAPQPAAAASTIKKVRMYDNYYSPAKLTIHSGQRVQWVWPSDVGDSHDVKLKSGPRGVKKFQSPPFATAAKWPVKPMTFTKSGTYRIYCSFHQTEMTMSITVKP